MTIDEALALADEAYLSLHPDAGRVLAGELRRLRAEVEGYREALQEIIAAHANDNVRPNAFYLAERALRGREAG